MRTVLLLLLILFGIVCILYPFLSNLLFERRTLSSADTYEAEVSGLGREQYTDLLEAAAAYNRALASADIRLTIPLEENILSSDLRDSYADLLTLDASGIMGYLEIPEIRVYLPIYHGTDTASLERGAGHLEGSSLPIGGDSTHAVLTGHTGMSTARLFTNLTELETGDTFTLHILNEELVYRVCDIRVVLPEDTSSLGIRKGEDLVTLVTCTPYGVNDHRLLVTGERVDPADGGSASGDTQSLSVSQWMGHYLLALVCGSVCALILSFLLFLLLRIRRKMRDA